MKKIKIVRLFKKKSAKFVWIYSHFTFCIFMPGVIWGLGKFDVEFKGIGFDVVKIICNM